MNKTFIGNVRGPQGERGPEGPAGESAKSYLHRLTLNGYSSITLQIKLPISTAITSPQELYQYDASVEFTLAQIFGRMGYISDYWTDDNGNYIADIHYLTYNNGLDYVQGDEYTITSVIDTVIEL